MGEVLKVKKVKLFFGFISNDEDLFIVTEKMLSKKFGAVDFSSKVIVFDYTDYYKKELGENLKRKFISFKRLVSPEKLSEIKLLSNRIEHRFSLDNKRRINIDPGYLSSGKLVLATTKDYSHRIYLKKGILAEVTLFYQDDTFQAWPWSYPDYKSKDYIEIFNQLYRIYIEELRRSNE